MINENQKKTLRAAEGHSTISFWEHFQAHNGRDAWISGSESSDSGHQDPPMRKSNAPVQEANYKAAVCKWHTALLRLCPWGKPNPYSFLFASLLYSSEGINSL